MAIKLATKKELENLNKQWKRSLVATKLTMKEAQLEGINDEQILSKIDNVLKLARDTTISPFGTVEVKGIMKTPNHYKHVNVVVDNLPERQCCRDVTTVQQIQTLKLGSNKILVVLRNLSCRTLKAGKGTKIAHVEASNIVPTMVKQRWLCSRRKLEMFQKAPYSRAYPRQRKKGLKRFWEVWIYKA